VLADERRPGSVTLLASDQIGARDCRLGRHRVGSPGGLNSGPWHGVDPNQRPHRVSVLGCGVFCPRGPALAQARGMNPWAGKAWLGDSI